jgi:hypothetical protein
MGEKPIYEGGIDAVLAQYEGRRAAFTYAPGEALAPLDSDLSALADRTVADPATDPDEQPPFRSSYHRKRFALRQEFTGASELGFLNGLVIAHLRKRDWPEHAPALFQRIWVEQGPHLLERLDPRWLVSAVTTFGDHGATPVQRTTGLALTALFGTMKLYESERLFSGLTPETPFPLKGKARAKLPLDMDAYSITSGGLDVNLIGRLWHEAAEDVVIAPLAHRLLEMLIHDPRSVLRRLRDLRARKTGRVAEPAPDRQGPPVPGGDAPTRRDSAPSLNPAPVPAAPRPRAAELRWGLVTTTIAPLPAVARFAAHHLELGAQALHIYLDAPDPQAAAFLATHPRVHVTQCGPDWWQAIGKERPVRHQQRQAHNATRTLHAVAGDLCWLGHFDVDEFLLCRGPVAEALAALPAEAALARVAPAEALARTDGPPRHFKLTHEAAGVQKARLQDIYPTFGLHLQGGFLSHTAGKVFARPGIPETRLGIHALKYRGQDATNHAPAPALLLAHLHAEQWSQFHDHLAFRLERGSYRKRSGRPELGQEALLRYLRDEEGETGLRAFFDEVCADTPVLRDRLAAHGMLVAADLDPDAAVARVFGVSP